MLNELRNEIDKIDSELINLLKKRFEIAEEIAKIKKLNNMPILDKSREKIILQKISDKSDKKYRENIIKIFEYILSTSKQIQSKLINKLDQK